MPPKKSNAPQLTGMDQFQGPFNPTKEQRDALYPYLSLGFRPTGTRRNANSALRALAASINAVRHLMAHEPLEKEDELTADDMLKWVTEEDEEYENLVEAHIENVLKDQKSKKKSKEYRDLIEELHSVEHLGVAQLSLILDRVNLELGLSLQLGVITEGFLSQWDDESSCWNDLLPQETRIDIVGDDDSTKRSSKKKSQRRTVIWIWNDNAQQRCAYQRPHVNFDNVEDHWEGFTICTRFKDPQAKLRNRIVTEGWIKRPIPAKIGEDFKKQLQRIGKELEGEIQAFGSSEDSDVSNPVDSEELSGSNDSPTSDSTTSGEEESAEEESEGESSGGRGSGGKRKGQGAISQDTVSESESDDQADFKIFRTIGLTNKIGNSVPNPDGLIDGGADNAAKHVNGFYSFAGDFLLDLSGRRPNAPWISSVRQMGNRRGIKMDGEIPMRRLQKLERAWGLPERLPIDPNGIPLPLRRVERTIEAVDAFGPLFILGEIVLEVPNGCVEGDGNTRLVYDYEGNRSWLREEHLTPLQNSPFGILVERKRMDQIWVKMGGLPTSDDGPNDEKSNGRKRSGSSSGSNKPDRKRPRSGGKKPGLYAASQKLDKELDEEQDEEDSEDNEDDEEEEEGSGSENNEDQDDNDNDDDQGANGDEEIKEESEPEEGSKSSSGRKHVRSPDSDPVYVPLSKRPRGTWGKNMCITRRETWNRVHSIGKTDSQTPQKNKIKDFHFAASRDDAQVQEKIKKAEQAIKEAKAVLVETYATL